MKRLVLSMLLLLLFATPALAKHKHPEKWYQEQWCAQHGGVAEYVLPDKTRVDCLTATHAWEFDFAGFVRKDVFNNAPMLGAPLLLIPLFGVLMLGQGRGSGKDKKRHPRDCE